MTGVFGQEFTRRGIARQHKIRVNPPNPWLLLYFASLVYKELGFSLGETEAHLPVNRCPPFGGSPQ